MKGLKAIAKKTQTATSTDRSTWVSLYYSIEKDTAYMSGGDGRFFMTHLINPCTEKDIEKTVHYVLSL